MRGIIAASKAPVSPVKDKINQIVGIISIKQSSSSSSYTKKKKGEREEGRPAAE